MIEQDAVLCQLEMVESLRYPLRIVGMKYIIFANRKDTIYEQPIKQESGQCRWKLKNRCIKLVELNGTEMN